MAGYQPKVYRDNGGDRQVIADGGTQLIEAGGNVNGGSGTGAFTFAAGEIDTADIANDAVDHDKLDEGVDQVADVTVSTAELLALNATPKQLVAAPGANKAIIFKGAVLFLDYNSAAYDGIASGEDLSIKYTDGSGAEVAQIETTGFLDQTADQVRFARAQSAASGNSAITPVANAALVLHLLTAEIATGNSPLKVRVYYRVVPTVL